MSWNLLQSEFALSTLPSEEILEELQAMVEEIMLVYQSILKNLQARNRVWYLESLIVYGDMFAHGCVSNLETQTKTQTWCSPFGFNVSISPTRE